MFWTCCAASGSNEGIQEGVSGRGPVREWGEVPVELARKKDPRILLVSEHIPKCDFLIEAAQKNVLTLKVKYGEWTLQSFREAVECIAGVPRHQFESMGLLCHGSSGSFGFLKSVGDGYLDVNTLKKNTAVGEFFKFLATYVKTKAQGGRIDLMSCSTAEGQKGKELIDFLEEKTKVTWAASTDATGAGDGAQDGFDWVLETHGDDFAVNAFYFRPGSLMSWQHLLNSDVFSNLEEAEIELADGRRLDSDDEAMIDLVNQSALRYYDKLNEVEPVFAKFVYQRLATIQFLWDAMIELEAHKRGSNKAELISHSVSVAGGVVGTAAAVGLLATGIAALWAAPFTGGTSLIMFGAAAGSGLGIIGGVGAMGTEAQLKAKISLVLGRQEDVMEKDTKCYEAALNALQGLHAEEAAILKEIRMRNRKHVMDEGATWKTARQAVKTFKELRKGYKTTRKMTQKALNQVGRYGLITTRYGKRAIPVTANTFKEIEILQDIIEKKGAIKVANMGKVPNFARKLITSNPEVFAKWLARASPILEGVGLFFSIRDLRGAIEKLSTDKPLQTTVNFKRISCQLAMQKILLINVVKEASDGNIYFDNVFLQNEKEDKILEVHEGKDEDGTHLTLGNYHGHANQIFMQGSDNYITSTMPAGRVLSIAGDAAKDGTPVVLAANRDREGQHFRATTDGRILFVDAKVQNLYLDVMKASMAGDAKIHLWEEHTEPQQRWNVIQADRGYIRCLGCGLTLSLDDGKRGNGRQLITRVPRGDNSMRWIFRKDGTIENIETGLYLDISQKTKDGRVHLWEKHSGESQKWEITEDLEIYSRFADKVLEVEDENQDEGAAIILSRKSGKSSQQFIYQMWMD